MPREFKVERRREGPCPGPCCPLVAHIGPVPACVPGAPQVQPKELQPNLPELASSVFLPQILLPWRTAQAFRVYYTQLCGAGPVCHLSKLPSSSVNDTCLMRPTKYITSMGPRNGSCMLKALKALAKLSVSECPQDMCRVIFHFFLCSAGDDEGRGPQQASSPLLRHPHMPLALQGTNFSKIQFLHPSSCQVDPVPHRMPLPSVINV